MSHYDDGENVLIRFDAQKAETDAAILIEIDGETEWIPKSQIAHLDETELWIPLWLAEKKGLTYE